jgi:hypothetical protein
MSDIGNAASVLKQALPDDDLGESGGTDLRNFLLRIDTWLQGEPPSRLQLEVKQL